MKDSLQKWMLVPSEWEDMPQRGDSVLLYGARVVIRCHRVKPTEFEIRVYDKNNLLTHRLPNGEGVEWMYFAPGTFSFVTMEEYERHGAKQVAPRKRLMEEIYPEDFGFTEKVTEGQKKRTLQELGVDGDDSVIRRQYL